MRESNATIYYYMIYIFSFALRAGRPEILADNAPAAFFFAAAELEGLLLIKRHTPGSCCVFFGHSLSMPGAPLPK